MTTAAYPDLVLRQRVSYIDPQINPDTRTAKVRVEVPNRRGELRFGMFADVAVARAGVTTVVVIPKGAVQNVGSRQIVYLASPDQPGKFVERDVRLGEAAGQQVEVLSGLTIGDSVVAEGSFFLRAVISSPSPPP